jgi:hypothetical protein
MMQLRLAIVLVTTVPGAAKPTHCGYGERPRRSRSPDGIDVRGDNGAGLPPVCAVWDYINRAMPIPVPHTLSAADVYALTAYIFAPERPRSP